LDDVLAVDLFAGALVDALVAHGVHGALVQPVEIHARIRGRRMQAHRYVYKSERNRAFPDGSRRHDAPRQVAPQGLFGPASLQIACLTRTFGPNKRLPPGASASIVGPWPVTAHCREPSPLKCFVMSMSHARRTRRPCVARRYLFFDLSPNNTNLVTKKISKSFHLLILRPCHQKRN